MSKECDSFGKGNVNDLKKKMFTLIIREMKSAVRFHFSPMRLAKTEKFGNTILEGVRKQAFSYKVF